MKRFTENPFFQKFRKERRHETTTTTTTTTEYKNYLSSQSEEISRSSEQQEEQFYGGNRNPKSLHFTQSLQDAFRSHPPMEESCRGQAPLSKEFPPLQWEPRHYQPRNFREEQNEFSEQFGDDKFIQRHRQKLFEFREQFNDGRIGEEEEEQQQQQCQVGHAPSAAQQPTEAEEQRHYRTMAIKRTTERHQQFLERRWQHSSLPPLDRFRAPQAYQQQTPHELVLDRFPPQLVQSVHQLTDAAERRHESNSRGFSPFPVFGPFIASSDGGAAVTPSRQQSVPPLATKQRTTTAQRQQQQAEMSMSMTTSQYKMSFADQSQLPPSNASAPMTSSSGDEWQSAYEFLPHSAKQMPMAPPKTSPKAQFLTSSSRNGSKSSNDYATAPFWSRCASVADESVQCTFALCKMNAYSRQLVTKGVWPMRGDGQSAEMRRQNQSVVGSIWAAPKVPPKILNESTTTTTTNLSERQANDEVSKLMEGGVPPGIVSPRAQMDNSSWPKSQQQCVKVEFSGPVNFLHATNLNVTNSRDTYTSFGDADEPGKKKNGRRQMGDSRSDQRDKMTISPPVERYIDTVCDLGPILAEIGQTLRAPTQRNFWLTPSGNIERMSVNEKESLGKPFGAITYQIGAIEQRKSTTRKSAEDEAHDQRANVPYLVKSTSQCHSAHVSAITQEWRLSRVPEESAECAAVATIRRQIFYPIELAALAHKSTTHHPRATIEQHRHQNVLRRSPSAVAHFACSSPSASLQSAIANAIASHPTIKYTPNYRTLPHTLMHRTQSADRTAMEHAQWWRGYDAADDALRNALTDVQREQAAARAYSKRCQCAEAERIERVIIAISEGLRRPMPVSKAQAEAKEELLRVRLAQLILNLDPDNNSSTTHEQNNIESQCTTASSQPSQTRIPSSDTALFQEYKQTLRAPIALLREKLRLLEHRLVYEDAGSIGTELRRISATPPLLRSEEQRRRHEALSVRSGEIARMTPLIGMLQHKLNTLDDACTRKGGEDGTEQEQHQEQMNRRKADENGTAKGRPTPYAERKTVHELLKRISGEIETIHELCRRDEVRDRLDAVLVVLKRVAASVDQITATLDGIGGGVQQKRRTELREEQRKKGEMDERENSALMEERQNGPDNEVGGKLERAINKQQKPPQQGGAAKGGREALAREEHQKRTEQLMKEMVHMFKQQTQRRNSTVQPQQKPALLVSTNHQWVHAVELSANFVRHPSTVAHHVQAFVLATEAAKQCHADSAHPAHFQQCAIELYGTEPKDNGEGHATSAEKGTGGKDRAYDRMKKRRFDQQTSRVLRQPNMPNLLQYDENDHVPAFKLGACPPSYLPRDEMPNRQQAQLFQYRLEAPPRILQQPKFLQLQQQHYYLCSSQEEEEEDEMTASSASALDSSCSLNVPILFRKKLSMCSEPTPRESDILLTDEEAENPPEESITEVFFLRRRRKHAMLNAIIYPETKVCLRASLRHGNNFEVVVERVSDCGRDSVVMVSEEFYDKRVLIRSGSPFRHSTLMEEIESSDEGQPTTAPSPDTLVDAHTKMAVSISARSDRDSVHVFLEEIPCGQIGLGVQASPTAHFPSMGNALASERSVPPQNVRMSASSDHVFRDVKVSEGYSAGVGTELENSSRSLRSSRRSSQKSLLMMGSERAEAEETVEDIPAYVIKLGSTASITCELNCDCVARDSTIEWFRGQNGQIVPFGNKFERVREEWVEVLVISDVQPEDGQLYSVKIDDQLYPVAYLIVDEEHHEDNDEMEGSTPSGQTIVGLGPQPQFLTVPQTQFVLQGETAILSVQMNRANLNVIWHKDGQILDTKSGGLCEADGRPRIWLEGTTTGWYRVIVNEVQFSDQGHYFAQFGEEHTNVQLIVEERIDEREVQVSSAETDDEELGDYLVPFGSTATIACELENVSFGYKLHWQRNHKDLDLKISSGDGKFEHVVNRTKHYLIIHNAQPEDSGVYSVRIGDAMFKVAQITVAEAEMGHLQQNLSGSRIRRISSQSLNQLGRTADKRPSESGHQNGQQKWEQ